MPRALRRLARGELKKTYAEAPGFVRELARRRAVSFAHRRLHAGFDAYDTSGGHLVLLDRITAACTGAVGGPGDAPQAGSSVQAVLVGAMLPLLPPPLTLPSPPPLVPPPPFLQPPPVGELGALDGVPVIPEAESWLLLGGGLLGVAALVGRRARRRRAPPSGAGGERPSADARTPHAD